MLERVFPNNGPYRQWDASHAYRVSNIDIFSPVPLDVLAGLYPKGTEWPTTREVFDLSLREEDEGEGEVRTIEGEEEEQDRAIRAAAAVAKNGAKKKEEDGEEKKRKEMTLAIKRSSSEAAYWMRVPLSLTLGEVLKNKHVVVRHTPILYIVARGTPFYESFITQDIREWKE